MWISSCTAAVLFSFINHKGTESTKLHKDCFVVPLTRGFTKKWIILPNKEFEMKKLLILSCLAALLLIPAIAFAQKAPAGDGILGYWFNAEKDAVIEVTKENGKFFGKVIWLKNPLDAKGKPKTDIENPDPKLKSRPRLGLVVLTDLAFKSGSKYEKGKIYDPKSGKTYSAQADLANSNLLKLRGFIGVSMIGKTSEWTRTVKPEKEETKAAPKPEKE
jgi:uncharacterized protein (DUF2147 family)